jgi:predicted GTPase
VALERRASAAGAAGAERAGTVVNRLSALATRADRAELSRRLEAELERQDGLESIVVVAGEPSQGKTSLINALLGQEDLLPVAFDACTGAYIVVRHGPRSQARVTVGDRTSPVEIAPEELDQWVTAAGNPANAKRVRSVEMTVDHPLLAGGLTLVDTPGVGGLDGAHGRTTLEALAFADALLFVSDASAPLSTAELGFLAMAAERIDTILFALSKIDQYAEWREILQVDRAALELLDERAATTHGAAPFVAVSSRAYLASPRNGEEATTGRERRRHRSGIPELESELSRRIGERAA